MLDVHTHSQHGCQAAESAPNPLLAQVHSSLLSRSLKPALAAEYRRSVAAVPLAVREAAFVEAADCFCALLGRAEVSCRAMAGGCPAWLLYMQ